MKRQLTANWLIDTDYGRPVYVAAECRHGRNMPHSLPEACACGLLRDVREQRGLTQQECADQIGVRVSTWAFWERGERAPTIRLCVQALERWLWGESDKEPRKLM